MPDARLFRSGKFSRMFARPFIDAATDIDIANGVATPGLIVELPMTDWEVDPGTADIVPFVNAQSGGGTIIDQGPKTAPTFTANLDINLNKDPYNKNVGLLGGNRLHSLIFCEYDPAKMLNTPAGPTHTFTFPAITGSPRGSAIRGKNYVRISGTCSTPDYAYVPLNAGTGTG